ncbi:glycoside hydrolase family 127 protein [Brachybacterium hainanense]|uniref:Glycoside hydrolase family 127 protein n=1 Tax=Brachybacterium hainanense TaxID=1541174 RepID=A0ABV6RFA6_9MICO
MSDQTRTLPARPDRAHRPAVSSRAIGAGPVAPIASTTLQPLPLTAIRLHDGFLARLQQDNGATSIPRGHEHLEEQQAWVNFENAAARLTAAEHHGPVFEDGEAFKWLEAVAWEEGRAPDDAQMQWLARYSALAARAQADDGYLSTFNQAAGRRERWEWISYDHEIFNMATMIQAAVAQHRTTGREELLDVARRAADHLDAVFGWAEQGKRQEACGHPLIEMALVELFRSTQEPRYLELARYFVDMRGHATLTDPTWQGWTPVYFSDRVPVREATTLEGHAVRAVYLASGATDVAIETGDAELLETLRGQWDAMVGSKMYLNGSLGARWEGEAFGDPYELPSDRGYGETCAAIASIQWSWRLLLATGEAKYADLIERQLYNAVLSGVSQDGDRYFYVNPLQVREGAVAYDDRMGAAGRQRWFGCSCCPTNLMRTVATIHHLAVTARGEDLQIHQYADGEIEAGGLRLRMRSHYPWDGAIRLEVLAADDREREISLRIPGWAGGAGLRVIPAGGDTEEHPTEPGSYAGIRRGWRAGDRIELDLPMAPRLVRGHRRVDAVRGSLAIERGPLVYALEHVDQPEGLRLDDVALARPVPADDAAATGTAVGACFAAGAGSSIGLRDRTAQVDGLGEIPVIDVPVIMPGESQEQIACAIPYFLWANRALGPMRVWIPAALTASSATAIEKEH